MVYTGKGHNNRHTKAADLKNMGQSPNAMSKIKILMLALGLMLLTFGGQTQAGGGEAAVLSVSALSGKPVQPGSPLAYSIVNAVCDELGVQRVPILRSTLVPNAVSVLRPQGSFIVYNPAFLNTLAQCNDFAAVAVLAHEVGHLYEFSNTPNLMKVSDWDQELRADYISGYVLGKLGASLGQATSSHDCYPTEAVSSHPGSAHRIEYITKGWTAAQRLPS